MATPDFILALREHIGHAPLWLPGVTAVVVDEARERMIAVRRRDNGQWTPITGIIDPGEEPARAGAREVLEEAGVQARPVRLVSVQALPEITHANGDRAQYLDLCFLYEYVSGEPHPADGENTQAQWFPLDALPPMNERFQRHVRDALADHPAARFRA